MFDGQMAYHHSGAEPVYVPSSGGRSWSDEPGPVDDGWEAYGELVRSAYTLRSEGDVFGHGARPAWPSSKASVALRGVRCRLLEA